MAKPTILILDDDPALRKMVSRNLALEGFEVATAADAKEALRFFEDHEAALVLIDVVMPDMDGFHVCERIRDFSNVPIIMLTVKDSPDDVRHGLDLGADDYITKPFDPEELVARISAVLRRAHPGS